MRARALAGAVLLAAAAWLPASAEGPVALSPEQMRIAVAHGLRTGDDDVSLALAQQLLARDPSDKVALIAGSRAARNMGRYDQALDLARQAWALGGSAGDRYAAALATAQALASDGKRTRAQWWLRRAAQIAPDETTRAVAARDFGFVRARNPWRSSVKLGLAPSSNINNGTSSEVLHLGGLAFQLSGDARALSGVEYFADLDTEFARHLPGGGAWRLGAGIEARRYSLSEAAQAQAPDASGDDFAFTAVEAKLGFDLPPGPRGRSAVDLALGHVVYGGEPLSDIARLTLRHDAHLDEDTRARISVSLDRNWRRDDASRSTTTGKVEARLTRRLGRDALDLSMGLESTAAERAELDFDGLRLGIGYALGRPVAGARLAVQAELGVRSYEGALFGAEPRHDTTVAGAITIGLPKLDYMGFMPEIAVRARRTRSSLDLHDSHAMGLSIGIRSAF